MMKFQHNFGKYWRELGVDLAYETLFMEEIRDPKGIIRYNHEEERLEVEMEKLNIMIDEEYVYLIPKKSIPIEEVKRELVERSKKIRAKKAREIL